MKRSTLLVSTGNRNNCNDPKSHFQALHLHLRGRPCLISNIKPWKNTLISTQVTSARVLGDVCSATSVSHTQTRTWLCEHTLQTALPPLQYLGHGSPESNSIIKLKIKNSRGLLILGKGLLLSSLTCSLTHTYGIRPVVCLSYTRWLVFWSAQQRSNSCLWMSASLP